MRRPMLRTRAVSLSRIYPADNLLAGGEGRGRGGTWFTCGIRSCYLIASGECRMLRQVRHRIMSRRRIVSDIVILEIASRKSFHTFVSLSTCTQRITRVDFHESSLSPTDRDASLRIILFKYFAGASDTFGKEISRERLHKIPRDRSGKVTVERNNCALYP